MTLDQWIRAERGRASELARALGVKHSTVLRWAAGQHSPRLTDCREIERATKGAVTLPEIAPEPERAA